MVSELAKGPGQIGQVLLAKLLDAPLCLIAKPGHQAFIVKTCRHKRNVLLLPKPLLLQSLEGSDLRHAVRMSSIPIGGLEHQFPVVK